LPLSENIYKPKKKESFKKYASGSKEQSFKITQEILWLFIMNLVKKVLEAIDNLELGHNIVNPIAEKIG